MNRYSITKLGPHDWRLIDRITNVIDSVQYRTRDEARAQARQANAQLVLTPPQQVAAA